MKNNLRGTLAQDLAHIEIGNLSDIATRFLRHGLRLPDPADPNFPPTLPLRGLFDLTGQQFDVADGVVTATIAATAPKFTVALVGAGVASLPFVLDVGPEQSPLWKPGFLDRIKNVGTELIAALKSWHQNLQTSDADASLLFELTLFASGTQQPVARLLDVEAPISGPAWWTS